MGQQTEKFGGNDKIRSFKIASKERALVASRTGASYKHAGQVQLLDARPRYVWFFGGQGRNPDEREICKRIQGSLRSDKT